MKAANFSMRVSLTMSIVLLLALALPQAQAYSSSLTPSAAQDLSMALGSGGEPGSGSGSGSVLGRATTPLQSVLNPDGTINMKSGFSGSLDAKGWQMVSAPGTPPHFVPSDKGAGTSSTASPLAPAVPGDENWDGRFGLPVINNRVYAVAVNSTTGDAFLGGAFVTPCCTSTTLNYITEWNRNNGFSQLPAPLDSNGTNNEVDAIAVNSTTGDMYAGGVFTQTEAGSAHHIARWNGSAWHALGSGTNDNILALAVNSSTGDVYAGGNFTAAGGVSAHYIARWNGSSWSALGSGTNNTVDAIAVNNTTGDVYVGGYFTTAGGVTAHGIAKWNGISWSALGSGTNNNVNAIAVSSTGDVYAGGYFTTAGGLSANYIAKWNGSAWSTLGSGSSNGTNNAVFTIALNSTTGDLYAGGEFTTAGAASANRIAKWDGSAWSSVGGGGGMDSYVYAAAVDSAGDLYAGGNFTSAGVTSAHYVAEWTGIRWSTLGSGLSGNCGVGENGIALNSSTGDVYVGGCFSKAGGVTANNIAKWDGSSWASLGSGMDNWVYATAVNSTTGDLYAGGIFTMAGGISAHHIAKWNGSTWSALGSGMNDNVYVIAINGTTGDVYAGGRFTTAGGVSANRIAKWNGSSWSALGSGMSGGTGPYTAVWAIEINSTTGDVYAGGDFTTAGGVSANYIARWNGSTWSALGSGVSGGTSTVIADIAVNGTTGDVYAGGEFTTAGGVSAHDIAKWNGSTWSALGSGMSGGSIPDVNAIELNSTTGDLYAGGFFDSAGGVAYTSRIAKWDGSAWSALGGGANGGDGVFDLALNSSAGDLYVGGYFTTAGGEYGTVGGKLSSNFGIWHIPGPLACSIQFSDVPVGSTFYPYIHCLACRGIVSGYPDGTFRPGNPETRAQLAKIVSNSAGFSDNQTTQLFQDVPSTATFFQFIGRLASRGYIGGYPCGGLNEPCVPPANLPYFRPNRNTSRGQIAKIDSNAAGFNDNPSGQQFEDVAIGSTYYTYTYRLVTRNIMSGHPCGGLNQPCVPPANLPYFFPNANATRGQTAKFVSNTFFPNCQTP